MPPPTGCRSGRRCVCWRAPGFPATPPRLRPISTGARPWPGPGWRRLWKNCATIAPVKPSRWKAICRDCAGTIDSLVELLQGRLAKGVMDRVCREGDGLFPAPAEIKLACSCPDWADMCKHVAAVLYGVGARLDEKPALLFELRGVGENQLLENAGQKLSRGRSAPAAQLLDEGDVAAL